MADGGHVVVGRGVNEPQHQVHAAQLEHKGGGQAGDIGGGAVGNGGNDQGQHQLAHGGQRRAEQVDGHGLAVLPVIGQEAAHQGGALHGMTLQGKGLLHRK